MVGGKVGLMADEKEFLRALDVLPICGCCCRSSMLYRVRDLIGWTGTSSLFSWPGMSILWQSLFLGLGPDTPGSAAALSGVGDCISIDLSDIRRVRKEPIESPTLLLAIAFHQEKVPSACDPELNTWDVDSSRTDCNKGPSAPGLPAKEKSLLLMIFPKNDPRMLFFVSPKPVTVRL